MRHAAKNKSADNLTPIEKWGLFFSYFDHDDKKDFINSIIQSENGIMAAQNFLAMGTLSAEQVAQGTGLPLEKVLELKDQLTVKA